MPNQSSRDTLGPPVPVWQLSTALNLQPAITLSASVGSSLVAITILGRRPTSSIVGIGTTLSQAWWSVGTCVGTCVGTSSSAVGETLPKICFFVVRIGCVV